MNFPVPWRALLPSDALEVLTGPNGSILREICNASGASVEISGEGETPETLSDKIVTISGAVEQKEAATRRAVDKLRVLQEVADQEPGVFVIIVPSCAAPMVVGQRGTQIKEVIELSGAEISVGKENILGMVDQPIGITGTGGQVVSAVSKINAILQDLADRGKLQPSDFKYRPGAVPKEMSMGGPREQGPRMTSTSNPRTHAKFVVATQVAGWIIGKQGRHIRELQENSGAHIQILKEGDVPPGVSPTDRIVEIGGRFDARAEGIQIVLMAIDSMPALAAPRETLMLVTRSLTQDAEIRDVQQMSGAEVEVRDLPGYDEALCTLLGTIEGRVKAAQQFLTRLEELAGSGAGPATPAPGVAPEREAYRQPAPAPAPAPAPRREEPPARVEPASTGTSDPWSQKDPWGGSAMAAKPASQSPPVESAALREGDPWSQPAPRAELPAPKTTTFREPEVITYNPDKPASASSAPPQQPSSNAQQSSFGSGGQQGGAGMSFGSGGQQSGAGTSLGAGGQQSGATTSFGAGGQQSGAGTSFGAGGQTSGAGTSFGAGGQQTGAGTSFGAAGQQSGAGTSFGAAGQQNGASTPTFEVLQPNFGGGSQQTSFGAGGQQNGAGMSYGGSSQQSGAGTSFGSSGQQNSATATSFGSNGQQGSTALANFDGSSGGNNSQTSFGGSGPGMGGPMGMGGQMGMGGMGGPMGMMNGMGGPMGMMGMGGMGGMGMGAMGPMAFQAMLQQSMMGQHEAQLAVLLPVDLIQQVLIPHGHLAEIAQTCNISIDLGAEISSMRQVSLRGTIAANAMAAYFLQERSLQYTGGKNP